MTAPASDSPAPDSIVFSDAHLPVLASGSYAVEVTQPVTAHGPAAGAAPPGPTQEFGSRARFHVLGARTVLQPSWIESRFPTASAGHEQGVLAHVVLTRSTLPWERSALLGGAAPWLAVLLLTEAEAAGVQEAQVPISTLRAPSDVPSFPGLRREPGETDTDPVRVLDAPRMLLEDLLPKASWLAHLSHVRERFVCSAPAGDLDVGLDAGKVPEELAALLREHGRVVTGPVRVEVPGAEWRVGGDAGADTDAVLHVERVGADLAVVERARAVVLGGRAVVGPPDGAGTEQPYRAYLVSLEGRYVARPAAGGEPDDGETFRFDWRGAGVSGLVRLVVLDRWDFAVGRGSATTTRLLAGLSLAHGASVPVDGRTGPGVALLRAGHALVPHRLRTGGVVRSWYRGPLVGRPEDWDTGAAVESADDLLLADPETDILFTSHAAAWELGRMLTVADPAVSLELVRWKSAYRRDHHRRRTAAATPHLDGPRRDPPPVPSTVRSWLRRLLLLDGVPFGYLVPDPAMLPAESLRTFRLDPAWLAYLLRGAVAAGRLPGAEPAAEEEPLTAALRAATDGLAAAPGGPVAVSGCLLRSALVSGWPTLHVDGWTGADRAVRCPVVRRARLSDNVLLVLFHGDVAMVDVHPNPEALHHALTCTDDPRGRTWSLTPREPDGRPGTSPEPVVMRAREVLDVAAARVGPQGPIPPRRFALRLVAGVPRLEVAVPP
ncbi:MAG: hypothetical protein AB7J32_09395 [Pseudonocardia sp.]